MLPSDRLRRAGVPAERILELERDHALLSEAGRFGVEQQLASLDTPGVLAALGLTTGPEGGSAGDPAEKPAAAGSRRSRAKPKAGG